MIQTEDSQDVVVGPYFNTKITDTIGLHSVQMGPQINVKLKQNIIDKFENKCFKSYGLIVEVYNVLKKEGGLIIPENGNSSARFKVDFSCKFCRPLKNSIIVCEVDKINAKMILLRNGPIEVYICDDINQINQTNFKYDKQENVLKGKVKATVNGVESDAYVKILKGTYINVRCSGVRIEHGTRRIIVLGIMENVATTEERDNANFAKVTKDLANIDYEEYTKNDFESEIEQESTASEGVEESEGSEEGEGVEESDKS